MKPKARLRSGDGVGDLPAIAPGRQLPGPARRRPGSDVEGAGIDRLAADVRFVAPYAAHRIPAIFPALAQQLEAQPIGGYPQALRIDGDHLELCLAAVRHRIL